MALTAVCFAISAACDFCGICIQHQLEEKGFGRKERRQEESLEVGPGNMAEEEDGLKVGPRTILEEGEKEKLSMEEEERGKE